MILDCQWCGCQRFVTTPAGPCCQECGRSIADAPDDKLEAAVEAVAPYLYEAGRPQHYESPPWEATEDRLKDEVCRDVRRVLSAAVGAGVVDWCHDRTDVFAWEFGSNEPSSEVDSGAGSGT